VTNAKLADNAVSSAEIAHCGGDLHEDRRRCRDDGQDSGRLHRQVKLGFSVGGGIADGAVTTAKLADAAVTSVQMADNAVTNAKLADNAVTSSELSSAAVTSTKIADGAVTTAKIPDGSITQAKLGFTVGGADGGVPARPRNTPQRARIPSPFQQV